MQPNAITRLLSSGAVARKSERALTNNTQAQIFENRINIRQHKLRVETKQLEAKLSFLRRAI